MWKKLTNNIESYYGLLASTILVLFIVPTRKAVDNSLKDQNIRARRSGLLT